MARYKGIFIKGAEHPTTTRTTNWYNADGTTPALILPSQAKWPQFISPPFPPHGGTLTLDEYRAWEMDMLYAYDNQKAG